MRCLAELDVLAVDCQATAAGPRGHLLELGWTRVHGHTRPHARLIKLPPGERIPPAVTRLTGISPGMLGDAIDAPAAWRELADEAVRIAQQPAPAIAHFARFERPFLAALSAGVPAVDLICTHDIARRLLPGLPRCSLRALTGYFGRAVGSLRRSAEHVEATAFVWQELVRLLEAERISTWDALHAWLATPVKRLRRGARVWPMPRDVRLALPDAPGVYRLLRSSGDVIYVGKASSLRHRVNSYFRKQHGIPERMLEMLSQVRAASFELTATALEAALLEPDEIKRHRPPYNIALTEDRHVWFTAPDLSERSPQPSTACPVGPFPSAQTLVQFNALAAGRSDALGRGRGAPDASAFDVAYARMLAEHAEMSCVELGPHSRLLRLGTRLWREGRRDGDSMLDEGWTPEHVQVALERVALRAALARRRARWLTRLTDAAIVWSEPDCAGARLLVMENGEIAVCESVDAGTTPPIPPGHRRPVSARHEVFTVARFDRLRVLTTELKRLVSEGAPVSLRFGVGPVLADARLAYALAWL